MISIKIVNCVCMGHWCKLKCLGVCVYVLFDSTFSRVKSYLPSHYRVQWNVTQQRELPRSCRCLLMTGAGCEWWVLGGVREGEVPVESSSDGR